MSLSAKFENTATRLLKKFDERVGGINEIQLEQTPVNFNPVTGEDELGTPVITDLIGVSVKFDRHFTNISGNNNTVQTGDQLLKITSAIEPFMNDKILIDGLKYSIVGIFPSRYTSRTVLYTVHIRR